MIIKYGFSISNSSIENEMTKITNQIYKLLPDREEGVDWVTPLETLMVELKGMNELFIGLDNLFLPLICKLEGLFLLKSDEDFYIFRRTILECLNLMNRISKECPKD